MYTADMLSRACQNTKAETREEEIEMHVNAIVDSVPV